MIFPSSSWVRVLALLQLLVVPLQADGEEPETEKEGSYTVVAIREGSGSSPTDSTLASRVREAGGEPTEATPDLPLGPPFPPGGSGPVTTRTPAAPPATPELPPGSPFPPGGSGPITTWTLAAQPATPPPPFPSGRSGADPAPGWPVLPAQDPIQEDVRANLGNLTLP